MRPLEVPVQVEQEEEEDKFVLNLPDGTSHRQVIAGHWSKQTFGQGTNFHFTKGRFKGGHLQKKDHIDRWSGLNR